jgi:U4/U6.U5 tri-snRNP-associated protein 3
MLNDGVDEEARRAQEEAEMMAAMGFPTAFDTTHEKDVGDVRTKLEGVKNKDPRKYRQYMNRRGGFNRPLDKV